MIVINAKEGMWLTQATYLKDETERSFLKQVSGYNVKAEEWRDATQEEKDAWEKEHPIEPIAEQ